MNPNAAEKSANLKVFSKASFAKVHSGSLRRVSRIFLDESGALMKGRLSRSPFRVERGQHFVQIAPGENPTRAWVQFEVMGVAVALGGPKVHGHFQPGPPAQVPGFMQTWRAESPKPSQQ
jgi:hypothetical protein